MSSATSSIQVSGLAKSKLTALRSQAKAAGLSPESYARRLLENAIAIEHLARTTTFDELLAPVQSQFRASGATVQELDQLVDTARTRHQRRNSRKRA